MFMHRTAATSCRIGIQPVHIAFGRCDSIDLVQGREQVCCLLRRVYLPQSSHVGGLSVPPPLPPPPLTLPYHQNRIVCELEPVLRLALDISAIVCVVCALLDDHATADVRCVCGVLTIVRGALYEGTLVTSRTTAQKTPKPWRRCCCWNSTAQLAAISLLLATLTLAARCYASTNATHPLLVQLPPNTTPQPHLSPIYEYSNTRSSSNLVLSRLRATPHHLVQSDTRIILSNSKVLLSNAKFIHWRRPTRSRTKREFQTLNASRANSLAINRAEKNRKLFTLRTTTANNNELSGVVSAGANNSSDERTYFQKFFNHSQVNASATAASETITKEQQQQQQQQQQQDSSFQANRPDDQDSKYSRSTARSMPPLNAHENDESVEVSEWSLILVVLVILTGAAFGLVTCLLNHHHQEGCGGGARTAASHPHLAAETLTTAPMLSVVSAGAAAGMGGMDRLRGGRAARDLAATRDRQVRLHAVHTDIAINLPPSIAMPDGEEHPFTSSRIHLRDAEQESEIYQKCIRPPPNRTVLESESPPPYRSSSAGILATSSSSSSCSSSSDWSAGSTPLVVRCHSMSSTSKPVSSHPHCGGQKTDFLQRTVKIFTSKKTQQPPAPAPTLPIVVVPSGPAASIATTMSSTSRPRRTDTRPKPSPGV